MKQLKTKSSMRAEEAKSHYNELITNTILYKYTNMKVTQILRLLCIALK
jgi:hypothetical protein